MSHRFSKTFYAKVKWSHKEYGGAFKVACADMDHQGWTPAKQSTPPIALARPCLLWADEASGGRGVLDAKWTTDNGPSGEQKWQGGKLCALGDPVVVGVERSREEMCNWAPPQGDDDFARHAGQVCLAPPPSLCSLHPTSDASS